jgi:nucleoside-diphosphate-sugar epimerase
MELSTLTHPPLPEGPVLVTGGAGFIGHHLVRTFLAQGREVRVLDDLSTGQVERLEPFLFPSAPAPARFDFRQGSVTDLELCRELCEGVGVLFHEAAIPSVQRSVNFPMASHHANATGTLTLLEAARQAGVRRFVYAGSSSAYGNTPELPKQEGMSSRPLSPYAVSKLAGEHYCQAYAHIHGMETVVLRYFNVFGPGQDPASDYAAVIPRFVTLALAGEGPVIHGDGEQTRDFTHIDNVIRANVLAATAPAERVSGRVFNVGCGERISIRLLWDEIRTLTGCRAEARHVEARPGDVRDSLASLTAIREAMGFTPEVGLREGLERTVEWFRSGAV